MKLFDWFPSLFSACACGHIGDKGPAPHGRYWDGEPIRCESGIREVEKLKTDKGNNEVSS